MRRPPHGADSGSGFTFLVLSPLLSLPVPPSGPGPLCPVFLCADGRGIDIDEAHYRVVKRAPRPPAALVAVDDASGEAGAVVREGKTRVSGGDPKCRIAPPVLFSCANIHSAARWARQGLGARLLPAPPLAEDNPEKGLGPARLRVRRGASVYSRVGTSAEGCGDATLRTPAAMSARVVAFARSRGWAPGTWDIGSATRSPCRVLCRGVCDEASGPPSHPSRDGSKFREHVDAEEIRAEDARVWSGVLAASLRCVGPAYGPHTGKSETRYAPTAIVYVWARSSCLRGVRISRPRLDVR